MLRDKGEVVDFQAARQQIGKSLESKQSDALQNVDKETLIKVLLDQGITADELQDYINNC